MREKPEHLPDDGGGVGLTEFECLDDIVVFLNIQSKYFVKPYF